MVAVLRASRYEEGENTLRAGSRDAEGLPSWRARGTLRRGRRPRRSSPGFRLAYTSSLSLALCSRYPTYRRCPLDRHASTDCDPTLSNRVPSEQTLSLDPRTHSERTLSSSDRYTRAPVRRAEPVATRRGTREEAIGRTTPATPDAGGETCLQAGEMATARVHDATEDGDELLFGDFCFRYVTSLLTLRTRPSDRQADELEAANDRSTRAEPLSVRGR